MVGVCLPWQGGTYLPRWRGTYFPRWGYLPWQGVPIVAGGTYLGRGVPTLAGGRTYLPMCVLATRWAVCLLRSRRRTFLYLLLKVSGLICVKFQIKETVNGNNRVFSKVLTVNSQINTGTTENSW